MSFDWSSSSVEGKDEKEEDLSMKYERECHDDDDGILIL